MNRVVVWVSGGVPSAIAAKITIDKYKNVLPVVLVNTDTSAEDDDNYRFLNDIGVWLNRRVVFLKSVKYDDPIDVYEKTKYLVGVKGARCSTELKKKVRKSFQDLKNDLQVFGYTSDKADIERSKKFLDNNPLVNAWFPLIEQNISNKDCHKLLKEAKIERPRTYDLGFKNANCLKTGCVKGNMGYWNWFRKYNPDGFWRMAKLERKLDVAICKTYKNGQRVRVFLDELEPNRGNYKSEVIECGFTCGE